jgi:hypothetical protein
VGVSAPVPSAWFWQAERAGTKAGAAGCVLAPDSTSVPLPILVRALVPLIVPEDLVLVSVPTASVPGVDRSDPEYLFVPDSIGLPPGLGEAKGSRMPAAAARAGLVGDDLGNHLGLPRTGAER